MKRALITGASSGIGRATAEALLADGFEVWGTSRDLSRLPSRQNFHPVRLDLTDTAGVETAFATAVGEGGRFDVIINNAGSGHFSAAEEMPLEEVRSQFQILFFSHVRVMQLAIAHLRQAGGGLIINVTSLAGRLPVPFMAAYNAAKAAMSAFTMSTQLELRDSGIRLVDLQPADILTNFNDAVPKTEASGLYAEVIAQTWKTVDKNMKNAPPPDLIARAVVRLIRQTNPPPRITVGDFFQSGIAPLIFRFLPQRVRIWGLRQYYRL
jgi:NAD(P)-dependent dehydrogenase (short-subunit alcohol dehydrogenase family)